GRISSGFGHEFTIAAKYLIPMRKDLSSAFQRESRREVEPEDGGLVVPRLAERHIVTWAKRVKGKAECSCALQRKGQPEVGSVPRYIAKEPTMRNADDHKCFAVEDDLPA